MANTKQKEIHEKLGKIFLEAILNIKDANIAYIENYYNKIKKTALKNTKKLEKSKVPHSIFDYSMTNFFTNDRNKRFYSLEKIDSEKCGLVNAKGELIVPFEYDSIGGFVINSNFIYSYKNSKTGLLDCLGNVVIEPIAEDTICFYEGLAAFCINNKYGYIDSSGNIVIPVIYDKASKFINGIAEVKIGDETFCINRKGEKIDV